MVQWYIVRGYITFNARNFYAIYGDIFEMKYIANRCLNFGGRNIFTSPSKSISDPVFEIEPTEFIHH